LRVASDLEVALLDSIYSELYRKYTEMLTKGAALGKELGVKGHSVMR
jgi:hypothetical protein